MLFWVGCAASLFNPIWGVANYMIAYQLHPPVRWWGEPLNAIGMRFSWLAMWFIILGLLFSSRRKPAVRPWISLWELGVCVLVGLGLFNAVFGIGFGGTAQFAFEKFWKLQAFVLILGRLTTTRQNLKIVIWTIVLGSLYMGHDAYTASPWRFSFGRLDVFGGPDMSTSSGASAHLVAMLPIIGIAFLIAKKWKWKILAAVSGAFTVNAIILCRTRSAFLGLLAGALAALLMAPRARRYRIHLLVAIAALVASSLTDTHYRERISTLTDQQAMDVDPAVVGRFAIWHASARIILDFPAGVGLGNFSRVIGKYDPRYWDRSSHSTIVTCFVELGIPGGVVFMVILFESIRLLYMSARRAHLSDEPLETKLIAYGLLVSLTTYAVTGLGTERFSCESFWWVLAFPLCLYRVVAGEAAQRVPTVSTVTHGRSSEQFGLARGTEYAM